MKTILLLLLIIALFSCNSAPVNIHHYLLNTPMAVVAVQKNQTLPIVVLKQVNIADYLRQSNLVMLLAQHELYYSRQDVWAESLQSSFYQALLQELNQSSSHNYVSVQSPLADKASTSISIDLAHFHSTYLSTVVAAGNYWLATSSQKTNKNDALSITENSFYYELTLQHDGFAHAVNQLRETVTKLAHKINQDIAALPHN